MLRVRSSRKWLVVLVAVVCGLSFAGIAAGQCLPIVGGCGPGCCDAGAAPLALTCGESQPGIFTITVSGQESTWFWIHARAYLEQPAPGSQDMATWQTLIAQFPWLAKDCWSTDPNASPTFANFTAVDPIPTLDQGGQLVLQKSLAQSHAIAAAWWDRAVQWDQPDLVRYYYQPISIGGSRKWAVDCQTWMQNVATGSTNPMVVWRPRLATNADGHVYTNNFDKYSAERIAQSAILEQAPCSQKAKQFLNQEMGLAAEKGMLKFTLSAVGAINFVEAAPIGPSDSQVPSILSSIPNENEPPRLRVSAGNPVTVPLRSAAASWGPWNGIFLGASASGSTGQMVVPMRGIFPPVTMIVSVNGETALLTGEFESVGMMRFPLRPAWVAGTEIQILTLMNRAGGGAYPWPAIIVQP